jgi:hypothetical protein
MHGHDDALARRVAVVLGAREDARVPGREVLVDARRRRLPEAGAADVDVTYESLP